jgi:hypothetical protein
MRRSLQIFKHQNEDEDLRRRLGASSLYRAGAALLADDDLVGKLMLESLCWRDPDSLRRTMALIDSEIKNHHAHCSNVVSCPLWLFLDALIALHACAPHAYLENLRADSIDAEVMRCEVRFWRNLSALPEDLRRAAIEERFVR